jgi:hypothetical protein
MYYDSLDIFACYVLSGIAVVATIIAAIKAVRHSTPNHQIAAEMDTGPIGTPQSWALIACFIIILQFLATVGYSASLVRRMIVGVLAERVYSADALITRLTHIDHVIASGLWITIILSALDLFSIILIYRKRIYRQKETP